MSQNRINVNGTWYIKEDQSVETQIEIDPTFSESCTVETDKYCYEASRLKKDNDTFYDDISIEVTTKTGIRSDWRSDYWDHNAWLIGVLEGNEDSLPEFYKAIPEGNEQAIFYLLLEKLVEIGWLKKT